MGIKDKGTPLTATNQNEAVGEDFSNLPDSIILEGHEPNPYPIGADKSRIKVLNFEAFREWAVIAGAYDPVGESVNTRSSVSIMSLKKLAANAEAADELRVDARRRLAELQKLLTKE
jgi:hypothetical protein